MRTNDIPEISFSGLSMGYPWDNSFLPEYQWLIIFHEEMPAVYQWSVPGISYLAEDTYCLSMTSPRDISCCSSFRTRSAGCDTPQKSNPPAKIQHSVADGSSSTPWFTISFSWLSGPRPRPAAKARPRLQVWGDLGGVDPQRLDPQGQQRLDPQGQVLQRRRRV